MKFYVPSFWHAGGLSFLLACGGSAPRPGTPQSPTPAAVTATESATLPGAPPPAAPSGGAQPRGTAADCEKYDSCAQVGQDLLKAGDRPGATTALTKACSGMVKSVGACATLTGLLAADETADPHAVADAAYFGCNTLSTADDSRFARAHACETMGILLRDGRGVEKNERDAVRAFGDGCTLGDSDACQARDALQGRADDGSGVSGATMSIGSVTMNGTRVEQVACKTDGGGGTAGVFGAVAIGKPFADKKRALNRCVKKGSHKARVRWQTTGGHMTDVKVISGDDPSNKCIERTLSGVATTAPGECAATILVGR